MRILLWHVHGGWADAFVRGDHQYLLPTTAARDGWGLGTGGRDWPNTVEIAPEELHDADVDVVLLQRPEGASPRRNASWAAVSAATSPPSTSSTTRPAETCRATATRSPTATTSSWCTSPTSTL